ncbi:dolichol kinase [Orussus abietinus]|uniref:dolichol kinase n=1 Tax=Orussus abietinus TaxID=222816 RepID=UPI000625645F|nr:dolichol kinase [Orussus abietinus]
MECLIDRYKVFEGKILQNLRSNGIIHRKDSSSGLWLGSLAAISTMVTVLGEENSYSEVCLLLGITGLGLIISCACLYTRLSMNMKMVKDFQLVYFLPSMITSMMYVILGNKGLLTSVLWGLSVGTLSTWGVVQAMSLFPGCFTLGEATVVTHGCILFLLSAASNLPFRYHLPPIHDDDVATVVLQVGGLFVMMLCLMTRYFSKLRSSKNFYVTTLSMVLLVVLPVLYNLLDQNAIFWVLTFAFGDMRRVFMIVYWALCLLLGISAITYRILSNIHASTSARKSFHLLAVAVYIPGLIMEPTLLYLASGVIMALFVLLELMRILNLPPLGELLQEGFCSFVDEKDSIVALTPLYLLSGLSFPLWMPTDNLELLPLLSGVLTVGVGDTAASTIGYKWGKHKWPGSHKSFEGTAACIISQLILIYGLLWFGFIPSGWYLLRTILVVIGTSLVEARTDQVDNLALPLIMYIALRI